MRLAMRLGMVVAATAALGACGSSSGPGVLYPLIGGTYSGSITYEMVGAPNLITPVVPGITVQLNDPDRKGNFAGAFAFNNGFASTGTIEGAFESDGVTIAWTQFGDTLQPLFYVTPFLALNYPCNFSNAAFTLNPNGGFDGNGNLDLAGTYTGIRCLIDNGGDSATTSMNVSLAVFNPSPEQTHSASSMSSALRSGVQHVRPIAPR